SDLSTELLHKICKAKGIRILTQSMTRIGYRGMISETTDFFDELFDSDKYLDVDIKNLDQLSAYVSQYRESTRKFIHKTQFSTWKRLKAGLKFFISYYDTSYKNYYRNFGRTRWKILLNEGLISLRKICRTSFLNKNSIYQIEENTQFVFFPIHFEPERAISIASPFYTNQIEVITQIAKSLPVGFLLYVKEHPVQKVTGWKDISFYKKILELSNVRLIHHSVSSEELLKKCSLVVTIAGTVGIEASFFGKPSIVLTDTQYSCLSFIHRLQKIEDLPVAIKKAIGAKVDIVELNKFVKFVFDNSFEYDELYMITELTYRFLYGGFPILDISHKKMSEFLEEYRNVYEKITLEYMKKINFWKTKDSKTF
ncbi:MAG: hypothetical protein KGL95_14770, partial [Patescibacteria group bacterium]|nr:hypothetical protein [Patescibacteria group bacterium]